MSETRRIFRIFLEQDLGIRTMEIVVPGGARFNNNNYRVFKTKDKSGQSFKVGLAVSVYGGEKNEKTMLAVAVDNGKDVTMRSS